MNKVKIFTSSVLSILQSEINYFATKYEIINCSICVSKHEYTDYYTAAVTYKEANHAE